MPFGYPVALELRNRRCVVIGGGELAEHKARGLLDAGAAVVAIAPKFTSGLEELQRRQSLSLIEKAYGDGDLEGAFLAIAATDDGDINAEVFEEAERRRVLLNAVDDIAYCHFAAPSIIRRGDFMMTISTGGKAPAFAKKLRKKLSADFGDEYGILVDLLGEVREQALPQRQVEFDIWALRWAKAMDQDLIRLVRQGRLDEAKAVVWSYIVDAGLAEIPAPGEATPDDPSGDQPPWGLHIEPVSTPQLHKPKPDQPQQPPISGKVWIVGAGPGDPGLLTVRGKQMLDQADVIVCDRLVNSNLTQGRETIYVGKQAGARNMDQAEINQLLIRLAMQGKNVVRLKGGDPFVFGRGGEEAEELVANGIQFEVVAAPTSAIAALSAAGIPVTDRRYSSSVAIATGHCNENEVDFKRLAGAVDTIVILMGLSKIQDIAGQLLEGGLPQATPAAVVENGTLASQRVITTTLADLPKVVKKMEIRSPAIIAVGEVVRMRRLLQPGQERMGPGSRAKPETG